jgi:hypothetical protein
MKTRLLLALFSFKPITKIMGLNESKTNPKSRGEKK